jgi:hypothetical protein
MNYAGFEYQLSVGWFLLPGRNPLCFMRESNFVIEPLLIDCHRRELAAQHHHAQALEVYKAAERKLRDAAIMQESGRYVVERELARGISAGELTCLQNSCLALEIRRCECEVALAEARRAVNRAAEEIAAVTREWEALSRFQDDVNFVPVRNIRRRQPETFREMAATLVNGGETLQLPVIEMA